ncbi:MAG: histidine--tRNA ligase [Anaerolineales bacterium]|nr:histidine--tRNA ligase [Anaerolineales bacterium]
MKVPPVKGTRDFYPEQMRIRNFIVDGWKAVSVRNGFEEYDGPIFEHLKMFQIKSGDEIAEQLFSLTDRGGRELAIRPEITPTLARMVNQQINSLPRPIKWFSVPRLCRAERPQKGRLREFFQWNIDLIGVDSPEADAELIALAASFLRETGLTPNQVQVLVNNRRLMDTELLALGIPAEKRLQVFRLIDRRDKMSLANWDAYAVEVGLTSRQLDGLKSMLADEGLWHKSSELERTFQVIEALGVADYVRFAPHVIRGLDYYTGTVFEVWDLDSEFRSILGGGRYDSLVEAVGGDPLPAVGFAMGGSVISLVLKKYDCLSVDEAIINVPVLVTVFSQELLPASFKLATELRRRGFNVVCYPIAAKLGKQFKFGDRMGIRAALILGPEELSQNHVAVKDLLSGEQKSMPIAEVAEFIWGLTGNT